MKKTSINAFPNAAFVLPDAPSYCFFPRNVPAAKLPAPPPV
jgi:hypothetical protein